jgi:hypothetical protein
MHEVEKLGRIIDGLIARKRSGQPLKRWLVFIIGNGIDPVNNIIDDKKLRLKAHGRCKTAKSFEAFKWRHFEYARYFSSASLPSFAHFCIYKLVETGVCRDVITTNYDMFFDTIWERSPTLQVYQNPVAETGEYSWEGYFSMRSEAATHARYWKIHGSLSHVCFGGQRGRPHHLHRLPRFAISANDDSLARKYRIPTQAPFMGFEMSHYPRTSFANIADLKGRFRPYIDWTWNNDRTRFRREIDGAKALLASCAKIAAVVLVGFSGYFNDRNPNDPWNEELVPAIRTLLKNGFRDVYMAVHDAQAARILRPAYGLMRELATEKRCWTFRVSGDFMRDLVTKFSRKFQYDYAETEYAKWYRWYLRLPEAAYV